ncbi:hypothetical protein GW17_00051995, partial [Ensete ventricosum]
PTGVGWTKSSLKLVATESPLELVVTESPLELIRRTESLLELVGTKSTLELVEPLDRDPGMDRGAAHCGVCEEDVALIPGEATLWRSFRGAYRSSCQVDSLGAVDASGLQATARRGNACGQKRHPQGMPLAASRGSTRPQPVRRGAAPVEVSPAGAEPGVGAVASW